MGYATRLTAFGATADSGTTIAGMPQEATEKSSASAGADEQSRLVMLLGSMAKGDEAALGSLYDAAIGRVYGFALRIVSQPGAAEEIASDVFLQAWREAGRYDSTRAKVMTWLLMICRSRALDLLRARESNEVLHDAPETLVDEPGGERSAPPDLLEAIESAHALHAALAKLVPIQRQLLSLAFFRGFSHQEIALHADLPLGTVKSHIRRAVEAMRDHMDVKL
ncbi:MAG: sigma-70 family RNA polymerase sigma factor [Burkholderiales bacterium]